MAIILGDETGGSGHELDTITKICQLAITWLGGDPALLSDVTNVTEASSKEDQLCYFAYNSARLALLEDKNWQFATRELPLNLLPGTTQAGWSAVTINNITAADPVVVTTANNHNFSDGWHVKISGVGGMNEINNRIVRVNNQNNNTFQCYGLDGTQFTAYTSGGNAVRYDPNPDYASGYIYEVPADYLRMVATLPAGSQYEIVGGGDSRRLLSPQSNLVIEYVANVTTLADMPEHFKRSWAARIAAELAVPLQKKGSARDDMWGWYQVVLGESNLSNARNVDAKAKIRERSPSLEAGGWSD